MQKQKRICTDQEDYMTMDQRMNRNPEVVSYEKMDDGKIKLIINAVWERTMQDNAMTSELVIQPLDNNRFHYISNQVIKSNLDDTSKWYRNRLTYGEWNKIYKENDEIK